jgi:hypothetical protein
MGWTRTKIAVSAVAAFAVAVSLAAPAHADGASFFQSLVKRGVSQYYTPDQALGEGQYLCQGLTAGRDFNSLYSDIKDYEIARSVGGPAGALGQVLGAAWNNLCPQFSDIGSTVNVEYIPKSQRD